jgi:hypothetical protein
VTSKLLSGGSDYGIADCDCADDFTCGQHRIRLEDNMTTPNPNPIDELIATVDHLRFQHRKAGRFMVHPETVRELRDHLRREIDDTNYRVLGFELIESTYVEKGRFVPVPDQPAVAVWRDEVPPSHTQMAREVRCTCSYEDSEEMTSHSPLCGVARRKDTGRTPVCTGLTAAFCPVCGTCNCDRDGGMDRIGCPLHGADSRHREGDS